ncbi:hypothetical protein Micbo1qcDRAFT_210465 [Microdochium bolleyi]|uniref:Uncharacterized protein n=1 Tax=Microdochium bolleyi TaxID=196109 RepID=A0A136IIC5_9PEZI|nr:hypothetical protein Micbo1qcDRAFT_210465 [Microdochium bolleyi]
MAPPKSSDSTSRDRSLSVTSNCELRYITPARSEYGDAGVFVDNTWIPGDQKSTERKERARPPIDAGTALVPWPFAAHVDTRLELSLNSKADPVKWLLENDEKRAVTIPNHVEVAKLMSIRYHGDAAKGRYVLWMIPDAQKFFAFGDSGNESTSEQAKKRSKTAKTAKASKASKEKVEKGSKVKEVVKMISATPHANFKRLKLKTHGAKGGPGFNSRFRRRR